MESKKFAWLPVRVTSGKLVWFKTYYEHRELFDKSTGRPPLHNLHYVWSETGKERSFRLIKESIMCNRNVWNDPKLTTQDII